MALWTAFTQMYIRQGFSRKCQGTRLRGNIYNKGKLFVGGFRGASPLCCNFKDIGRGILLRGDEFQILTR